MIIMSTTNENEFVKLPYKVAKNLIEEKISELNNQIETILTKWNQMSIDSFTKLSREGKIPEAEMDAIVIENLKEKLEEYKKLLQKSSSMDTEFVLRGEEALKFRNNIENPDLKRVQIRKKTLEESIIYFKSMQSNDE